MMKSFTQSRAKLRHESMGKTGPAVSLDITQKGQNP